MYKTWFRLILARTITVLAMVPGLSFGQGPPSCEEQTITYSPFDEQFAERMTVQPGPAPRSALIMGDKRFTRQGTRWLVVSRPDYMRAGPWATVVWVGDRGGSRLLQLTFLDHSNGGANVQWLNEKLLYGSVWWGRIVSSDFIFDAEKKTFLYREMANYGQPVRPCQ